MASETGKADNEYRVEDDNSIPHQRQQQQQRANEGEDQDQPQDHNDRYKRDAGRRTTEHDTKSTTPIQHQKAATESIINSASTQKKLGWKDYQLEILCEPLYHFLCGSSSCERFTGRYGGGSGARGGATRGRKTTRDRKGSFRFDGCRASWREVRRFLEALCRGAGVDAECTSVAMVALEREGFSTDSRGTAAGHSWTPEIGVDFNGFVAAVRAVLLFEGFEREARKALLELTGTVDGSAPLGKLLERLFPSERADNGGVEDVIRERLDLRLRGETKVRLSTITDCVFRSPTDRKTHAEKLS